MNEVFICFCLFLLTTAQAGNVTHNEECKTQVLPLPTSPTRLTFNISNMIDQIFKRISNKENFTMISEFVLSFHADVSAAIFEASNERILAVRVSGRPKLLPNRTKETGEFWRAFNNSGWIRPFRDCYFLKDEWFYGYISRRDNATVGLFIRLYLSQCDESYEKIFNGHHQCDSTTTYCVPTSTIMSKSGQYICRCKHGYHHPGANHTWKGFYGEDIERGTIENPRCLLCPEECDACENGICVAKRDVYLKTIILSIHLSCMGLTIFVGLIVFKQRKAKSIATSMWTILETILFGLCILYSTLVVDFFPPSTFQCLMTSWTRELGFVVTYGAIVLKLYRHLIEFRTRKAHRWIVKDTDLLKYLLIMTLSTLAYLAAYTALALDMTRQGYAMLEYRITSLGLEYEACRLGWWDYVTEGGEVAIMVFGIHLSYGSRNARTQFQERAFLCAAISLELAVSTIFYLSRVFLLSLLHPDTVMILHCLKTQLSTTMTFLLVFLPKFWYQHKQVRSLAQDYSCRIPVDAFKDVNAHGPLTSNNSDIEVGEITLADMSPDDIRAELKRLYLQLEIFKSKTICKDNPHISKRRGGRKAQHRRFSLQKKGSREKNLHGKHKVQRQEETTEAEASRTPEDSVCSNEGPSAIYCDLPSTTDHK